MVDQRAALQAEDFFVDAAAVQAEDARVVEGGGVVVGHGVLRWSTGGVERMRWSRSVMGACQRSAWSPLAMYYFGLLRPGGGVSAPLLRPG